MPYTIQWKPNGAVKCFTGAVTFEDVIKSEREVAGNPNFTALRYVKSLFLNAQHLDLNDAERLEVRAQRAGGFYSNPRIKYAFVTEDEIVKEAIDKSVTDGHTLFPTRVFKTYEAAFAWATK